MTESPENNDKPLIRYIGLLLGLILFILIYSLNIFPENPIAGKMAAVAILMAVWWISEAVPLAVTSLLPLILFPLLGIMNTDKAASEYANSTIFLFLGGFLLALAMEKWDLHRRVSLLTIILMGKSIKGIILGFMLASAIISMFISNTATAIMMMPIGLSVILKLDNFYSANETKNFGIAVMLGIAYACSIGGIATLIGTVPNLVFTRIFSISFPNAPEITFGNWMFFGVPLAMIMLFIVWLLLTQLIYKTPSHVKLNKDTVAEELKKLGKMSFEETLLIIVLGTTALLWIFRKNIVIGDFIIHGWSEPFYFGKYIDDATIAVFMALMLFIIPTKNKKNKSSRILDIKNFKKVPWDIIILFGGGFALAKGFQDTGLSVEIGKYFEQFAGASPLLIVLAVCFVMTFLTELTSNTATTQTVLPILASLSIALNINPLLLMIPATISASFAFMLPVATPPNAIVFGTRKVKISEMVKAGLIINLVGVFIITFVFYAIGSVLFGFDLNTMPDWTK